MNEPTTVSEPADPAQEPDPFEAPDLNEQMRFRLDKRARLLTEGVPPYPVDVPRSHSLEEVRKRWGHLQAGQETQEVVGVSGRVIYLRNSGKLCFASLQDGFTAGNPGERLQLMISLAEVGQESLDACGASIWSSTRARPRRAPT